MNSAIDLISRPTENQSSIANARSFEECVGLVKKYHKKSMARALDFVEAWFWLGATVARAVAMTNYGDGVMGKLSDKADIPVGRLRDAASFYKVHLCDFDMMREWALRQISDRGTLLKSDVTALVKSNPIRKRIGEHISGFNGNRERLQGEYPEERRFKEGEPMTYKNCGERGGYTIPELTEPKLRKPYERHEVRNVVCALSRKIDEVPTEISSNPVTYDGMEYIVTILVIAVSNRA